MKQKTISLVQKKQLLNWWLPYLLSRLRETLKVDLTLIPSLDNGKEECVYPYREDGVSKEGHTIAKYYSSGCLRLNSCTWFPLFLGSEHLGIFRVSNVLKKKKAQQIRSCIDRGLCQISRLLTTVQTGDENSVLWDEGALFSHTSAPVVNKASKKIFLLLVKDVSQGEVFRLAHELYLNNPSSFAFLTEKDFEWTEELFSQMEGVFFCITSFSSLSMRQKKLLKTVLSRGRPRNPVVIGVGDQKEWLTV